MKEFLQKLFQRVLRGGSSNDLPRGGDEAENSKKGTSSDDDDEEDDGRGHWGNRAEFLLSCIGMSVGLGNIWRFPYLTYKHGGAAFLIPYFILLVLVGKPIYFLEIAIGQFSSTSSLAVWRSCPIGKGIGWAMQVVCLVVCVYYNVVVAYTLFYLFASFRAQVPWAECAAWWGADERCYVRKTVGGSLTHDNTTAGDTTSLLATNATSCFNGTVTYPNGTQTFNVTCQTASAQFWNKYVLHIHEADGVDSVGEVRWELALCLLLAWIIVYVCIIKGIKSSGKVVYFTATFPYVILLILMIQGLTLEGSGTGLKYLFVPEWSKLLELSVWKAAAEQMFFSLGISWGIIIMFGSYNNFRNKTHIDALVISFTDFGTSIIGCITIFSVLGYLANQLGVDISKVAEKGTGLAFVAYPEAITHLPIPQLWAVLFFFMLFTLGLDSEFATMEAVLSNIQDEWPKLMKYKPYIVLGSCVVCFLIGLPCVTSGGQFVFHLMDTYAAGTSVIIIAFFEMVAFNWIYGARRLIKDFEFMLNTKMTAFWFISWAIICPVFLAVIFVLGCVYYTPTEHNGYQYPAWAEGVGWCMFLASVLQIPIWALVVLYQYHQKGDVMGAFRPTEEWGPSRLSDRLAWEDSRGLVAPPPAHNGVPAGMRYRTGIDNFALSRSSVTLADDPSKEDHRF